ncbi:hypothetical protein Cpap_1478 [Ruminiclostridium papyrosolvens DSM 2782]|uniref:Uncharacterized protein n=1 Tax=Ruminiclostridium papyrosolvens DSM 2782 TaxID=588581 RepID=F1TEC0_9FIRM|nr:hypothetical protein [Ruminiclostridium papyrosolvens]EGD47086.1 hypothetical protein Cpap_1478 [Ruminiclostridium papyrosolvens DSM 2782]WES36028.1 hypothetical protein P0092_08720 [Ruminiclostridium papyrosolvens DSM 2782]WES36126.1 hypothetical protein P0092_09220 [Ruminiclostridium papyrosolvens DSM 2782]
MDEDEKIKYLANELVKSIQASGRIVSLQNVGEGFGRIDINLFNIGTKKEELCVENILNKWSISTKPTFGKLEVRNE